MILLQNIQKENVTEIMSLRTNSVNNENVCKTKDANTEDILKAFEDVVWYLLHHQQQPFPSGEDELSDVEQ